MENIKAILLDVDNTLLSFDAYVRQSMKDGLSLFHLGEFTEEKFRVFEKVNGALWHQIEQNNLDFETLKRIRWNLVFAMLDISYDGVAFEEYFRDSLYDSAICVDGAMDLLEYLSQKYDLYVASNGPYKQQMHRIEIANMSKYFKGYFISEEIGASKPSEEFFQKGLSRIDNIKPQEVVIIGDSLSSDMLGGINSGIHTIWYNRGKKENQCDVIPEYTISHLSEIKNIL